MYITENDITSQLLCVFQVHHRQNIDFIKLRETFINHKNQSTISQLSKQFHSLESSDFLVVGKSEGEEGYSN